MKLNQLLAGASMAAMMIMPTVAAAYSDPTPSSFDVVVTDTDGYRGNAVEGFGIKLAEELAFKDKGIYYDKGYIEFYIEPSSDDAFTDDDALVHIKLTGAEFWRNIENTDLFGCQVDGRGRVFATTELLQLVGPFHPAFSGRSVAFSGKTYDKEVSFLVSETNRADDAILNEEGFVRARMCFRLPIEATGHEDIKLEVSMETNAGAGARTPIDGGYDLADNSAGQSTLVQLVDAFKPFMTADDKDEIISVDTHYNKLIDTVDFHDQNGLIGFTGVHVDESALKVMPGSPAYYYYNITNPYVSTYDIKNASLFVYLDDLKGIGSAHLTTCKAKGKKGHSGHGWMPYYETEWDYNCETIDLNKQDKFDLFEYVADNYSIDYFANREWRIVLKADGDDKTKIAAQGTSGALTLELDPACFSNSPKQGADSKLDSLVRDGTELVFPWTASGTTLRRGSGNHIFRFGNLGDYDTGSVFARVENYADGAVDILPDTDILVAESILVDDELQLSAAQLEAILGDWVRGDLVFTVEARPQDITGRKIVIGPLGAFEQEAGSLSVAQAEGTGN